jgi:mRNA interferase MazF
MLEYIFALLEWCKIAIFLRGKDGKILFKEGEIWWCNVGLNVGVEIFGKGKRFTRPVLVFKKFSSESFLGIPLTSHRKQGSWYAPICFAGIEATAILNQALAFDRVRLTERMGTLNSDSFQSIRQAFIDLYSL